MYKFIIIIWIHLWVSGIGNSQDSISRSDAYDRFLYRIDSLVALGLDSTAYPGAQVYIYQGGKELLHKSYGYHDYSKKQLVRNDDLYDLASITKVSTGLAVLMKLYGQGKINLNSPLENYYPYFEGTPKGKQTLRNYLLHQAGLQAYIAFWRDLVTKSGHYKRGKLRTRKSRKFPVRIDQNHFLNKKYRSKIFDAIRSSEFSENPQYVYSDLFFVTLPDVLSRFLDTDFEAYLQREIYHPIHAASLVFNPFDKYSIERIIPTENDTFFRNRLVKGFVHDETAAMLGGISGHAGLFGNASDIAKLFTMYMHMGKYGNLQILDSLAVRTFSSYQDTTRTNHRGLGFDKPLYEYNESRSYCARDASPESFGHSGFTGTFVWADPKYDLLLVFLTNRVHPDRANRKLYTMGIRPALHQCAYDFLKECGVDIKSK